MPITIRDVRIITTQYDQQRLVIVKLLTSEHLSVQEVAEQSGFAEAAAFCRAFKRWTGQSPAHWRRQHQS